MLLVASPDVVDLWLAFYEGIDAKTLERYRGLLTPDEMTQQRRFHFARDQVRYLVTRALARTVLSRYAAVRPEEWRFTTSAHGRPEIANSGWSDGWVSFNISHTAGLIALGVTGGHALGIDTEHVGLRRAPLDIADAFFSPQEAQALRIEAADTRHERFFDYWTLKESYIKAKGKGLSIPLDQFSFSFPSPGTIGLSCRPELDDDPARWLFWQVRPSRDHVAAICVARTPGATQRLVTRSIVPLGPVGSFECAVLRRSA